MSMNPDRPYLVLAKLDSDAQWFIRNRDGTYTEWEPRNANVLRRTVAAHRLIPVFGDFCRYSGDWYARSEIYSARNEISKGSHVPDSSKVKHEF